MTQKLDIGNVLSRTFDTYKEQFSLLIPAALLVFIPVGIINGLLAATGNLIIVPLTVAIGAIAGAIFTGMIVEAVNDMRDGRRDHTIGTLIRSPMPVIVPLILASILAGIGLLIGFILLVIPFFILLTFWAVVSPVIVMERPGVINAFKRSMELVKGNGWQVFGVLVVFFLISFVAGAIVGGILGAVSDNAVSRGIANLIVNVLVTPLSAIAAAIMYFELKEGRGATAPPPGAPASVGAAPDQPTAPQPAAGEPASPPPPPPGGGGPQGPQSPGGPQSPAGP